MAIDQPKLILLTGAMAAGKSTVAQALAEAIPHSVHLRGDVFRRMIVNGRANMGAAASDAALTQLNMRYSLARDAARTYLQNGFNVIYQDVVLGPLLLEVINLYSDLPLHVVVLCPNAEVIEQRERVRHKSGYHNISVAQLQEAVAQTPRRGYWLDNSSLSVAETVATIMQELPAARIATR